jgi:hypothetical protein
MPFAPTWVGLEPAPTWSTGTVNLPGVDLGKKEERACAASPDMGRGRMPFAPTWVGLEPTPTRGKKERRMTSEVVNRDG